MSTHDEIRDAVVGDAVAIAQLLSELNRDEAIDIVASPEAIAHALFASNRAVNLRALVAVAQGAPCGVLLYYPGYDTLSATEGYHLADMVVTHAHRRSGIGRALFTALAERACADDKHWVSLTALRGNAAARAFYLSLGMTPVDVDFYAIGSRALQAL
ncbi:MAG: GNAT family N-acetyltransferase [Pseudomonadota bacterium]